MAWQGRKPLTQEERALRSVHNGGVLTVDEQDKIIDLVSSGVIPTDAIKQIHRGDKTLLNTRRIDPEFERELESAKKLGLGTIVESALLGKALGRTNMILRRKRTRVLIDGVFQYNEGN
jgi:hypothetical protein